MQVYKIKYFTRPDGEQPARKWIKSRDGSIRPNIYKKLGILETEGLARLGTNFLDVISGPDRNFYELRNTSLNWRIGFYYNEKQKTFWLLHGWSHDENHKEEHQKEIEKARGYLHEYLAMEKLNNG
jgi:hypothetical protein